jgi:hypothetical protein
VGRARALAETGRFAAGTFAAHLNGGKLDNLVDFARGYGRSFQVRRMPCAIRQARFGFEHHPLSPNTTD